MKGACAGCPSSTITLKHGVERMIKHYVPEVNSVEALNFDENNFTHLENLINVAEENQVEEYLFIEIEEEILTAKQLELILLKSGIQPPEDLTPKISKKNLKNYI